MKTFIEWLEQNYPDKVSLDDKEPEEEDPNDPGKTVVIPPARTSKMDYKVANRRRRIQAKGIYSKGVPEFEYEDTEDTEDPDKTAIIKLKA